jgi:acyl carrier protein
MGLDSVELVMKVEAHFDISLPDDQASQFTTVGKLHAWVVNELSRLNRKNADSPIVFDELRELICDQLSISPDRVVPEARFVQDLHID